MTTRRPHSRRTVLRPSLAALLGTALLATFAPGAVAARHTSGFAAKKSLEYVVPAGVTSVVVDLAGATGRDAFCGGATGRGGEVTATIPVVPGEHLQLNIGDNVHGSLSGNASDIRRSPYTLDDRLVVAGGGGSDSDHGGLDAIGNCKPAPTGGFGEGGDGGAPDGLLGRGDELCSFLGGRGGGGGTQVAPGGGGDPCGAGGNGAPGTFGFGGAGGDSGVPGIAPCDWAGAGGDGWYGGGGGAGTLGGIGSLGGCFDASGTPTGTILAGGGGGGSSHAEADATGVVYQVGVNADPFGWVSVVVGGTPTVRSVSPYAGPIGGGQKVTIVGSHFTGATAVRFGTMKATHVAVLSSGKVTARAPAHAAGAVHVRVTSDTGTSPAVTADRYTYLKAPVVDSVSPRSGPKSGGQRVIIVGTHLRTAFRVLFGTVKGQKLKVLSDKKITVRSPHHSTGPVDVRVRTLGGLSAKVKVDRYTYR